MLDAIKKRYSVRNFKDKEIPAEILDELLNSMVRAPSGNNQQAWKFILITGMNRRKVASACVQEFVGMAPVLIVALSEKNNSDYNLAFAVDHLMLEAANCDLGTCVIRSFDQEQVKSILNIPENYHIFAIIPVGYPNGDRIESPRKKLEEVICRESFY